jgi:hypothetical protein
LGRQRAEQRELIAEQTRERLNTLGGEPVLSAEQLANVMLALSNGLAIEQLVQPEGVDPDLLERTVELITVGLQDIGAKGKKQP